MTLRGPRAEEILTNVLAIEPGSLDGADEELGAVGVGAGVSHAENTRTNVLELKVLVLELVSVDRVATTAVAELKVTALDPARPK